MNFKNIPVPKSDYYSLDKNGEIWIDVGLDEDFNAGNVNEYMSLQNKFLVCALFEKELFLRIEKNFGDGRLVDFYNRLIVTYRGIFDISQREYFITENPEDKVEKCKAVLSKWIDKLYLDGKFLDDSFVNCRSVKAKWNKFQKMSKADQKKKSLT